MILLCDLQGQLNSKAKGQMKVFGNGEGEYVVLLMVVGVGLELTNVGFATGASDKYWV